MKTPSLKLLTFIVGLIIIGLSCHTSAPVEWNVGEDGSNVTQQLQSGSNTSLNLNIEQESYCIVAFGIQVTVTSGSTTLHMDLVQALPYNQAINVTNHSTIEVKTEVVDLSNGSACVRLGNAVCKAEF